MKLINRLNHLLAAQPRWLSVWELYYNQYKKICKEISSRVKIDSKDIPDFAISFENIKKPQTIGDWKVMYDSYLKLKQKVSSDPKCHLPEFEFGTVMPLYDISKSALAILRSKHNLTQKRGHYIYYQTSVFESFKAERNKSFIVCPSFACFSDRRMEWWIGQKNFRLDFKLPHGYKWVDINGDLFVQNQFNKRAEFVWTPETYANPKPFVNNLIKTL